MYVGKCCSRIHSALREKTKEVGVVELSESRWIAKEIMAKALIALETVSRVRRDTATLGRCDVKQRKHNLRHISGSTALLLIRELLETIGETETRHIFHENPLGSHRVFWCAAIKVDLWNRDRCARYNRKKPNGTWVSSIAATSASVRL